MSCPLGSPVSSVADSAVAQLPAFNVAPSKLLGTPLLCKYSDESDSSSVTSLQPIALPDTGNRSPRRPDSPAKDLTSRGDGKAWRPPTTSDRPHECWDTHSSDRPTKGTPESERLRRRRRRHRLEGSAGGRSVGHESTGSSEVLRGINGTAIGEVQWDEERARLVEQLSSLTKAKAALESNNALLKQKAEGLSAALNAERQLVASEASSLTQEHKLTSDHRDAGIASGRQDTSHDRLYSSFNRKVSDSGSRMKQDRQHEVIVEQESLIRELRERLHGCEMRVEEERGVGMQYRTKLRDAQERISELEAALAHAKDDLRRATREHRSAAIEAAEKLSMAEERIRILQEDQKHILEDAAAVRNDELHGKLRRAEKELEMSKADVRSAEEKMRDMHQRLRKAQQEETRSRGLYLRLQADHDQLVKRFREAEESAMATEKELAKLRTLVREQEEELSLERQVDEDLLSTRSRSASEAPTLSYSQLMASNAELRRSHREISRRLREVQTDSKLAQAYVRQQQRRNELLSARVAELESELVSRRTDETGRASPCHTGKALHDEGGYRSSSSTPAHTPRGYTSRVELTGEETSRYHTGRSSHHTNEGHRGRRSLSAPSRPEMRRDTTGDRDRPSARHVLTLRSLPVVANSPGGVHLEHTPR